MVLLDAKAPYNHCNSNTESTDGSTHSEGWMKLINPSNDLELVMPKGCQSGGNEPASCYQRDALSTDRLTQHDELFPWDVQAWQ